MAATTAYTVEEDVKPAVDVFIVMSELIMSLPLMKREELAINIYADLKWKKLLSTIRKYKQFRDI